MLEDANELPYPRIEELAGFKGVFLGEKLERFCLVDAVSDLAVLVHARRAIAVELAESAAEVIFVQEYVDAGERQRVGAIRTCVVGYIGDDVRVVSAMERNASQLSSL